MKKLLFIALFAFVFTNINAQFYSGLSFGYGIDANKSALGTETSDDGAETQLYGSFGEGFNITGKFGYMLTEHVGLELGVNYLIGATQTLYKANGNLKEGYSNALVMIPQLVLKTKVGLYSRLGFVVPVVGKTTITTSYDKSWYSSSRYTEEEFHGSFTLGFAATLGYSLNLSDKLSIFGEVQYQGLSVVNGSSEYTTYEVGGENKLNDMDTYDIETEYVETLDDNSNNDNYNPNYDKDSAKEELAGTTPFSSLVFSIGIVYTFKKK